MTRPGLAWIWRLRRLANNGPIAAVVRRDGTHSPLRYLTPWNGEIDVTDDGRWLAPVAPHAPPTRTAAEARANPMRGDRWKCRNGTMYTITKPPPKWDAACSGCWLGGPEVAGFSPGLAGETYLGNFAHELEAP